MARARCELAAADIVVCLLFGAVQSGWTLLHKAAYNDTPKFAELLLGSGGKVYAKGKVRAHCNSLCIAC